MYLSRATAPIVACTPSKMIGIGALRSSCSRRTRTRKIAGYITLVHTGNADVLAFVKDRIAGKPATASC